ncbi:hypothetical protein FJ420_02940 [Mesorhizobium sp. B3-1-3]|uniref:hypothetical protein n=1 Tax=unclassified Mesorhizobium TaxID=325217 RepID=UPI001125B329|nr:MULTISPECIES: hypothetical protein [unclassified Mesorhizobium]TPI70034.1 hypothetical protein FJ424_03785 [Mesorhizobium sp. B3-1-8]TPI75169.1 hypothetical protein FJ420_02940 [Mesorhizobium sp. B3-1-3]
MAALRTGNADTVLDHAGADPADGVAAKPAKADRPRDFAMGRAIQMNLQGRIPDSAKEVASSLQVDTAWQKYQIYNLVMEIALTFQSEAFELLAFEPADHDTHKIDADIFESPDGHKFRKKYKAKNGAEFFRHAMHKGTSLLALYQERSLPKNVTPHQVFDAIATIMGDNGKFKSGLTYLQRFREKGTATP